MGGLTSIGRAGREGVIGSDGDFRLFLVVAVQIAEGEIVGAVGILQPAFEHRRDALPDRYCAFDSPDCADVRTVRPTAATIITAPTHDNAGHLMDATREKAPGVTTPGASLECGYCCCWVVPTRGWLAFRSATCFWKSSSVIQS